MNSGPGELATALALLIAANGAPVVAATVLHGRFDSAIDRGHAFVDGRPLFGSHKTWRGLVAAISASTVAAMLLDLEWHVGMVFGAAAMVGDIATSFAKRRLDVRAGGLAFGLDQIVESALPLWLCHRSLGLDLSAGVLLIAVFIVSDLALSRALHRFGLKNSPY